MSTLCGNSFRYRIEYRVPPEGFDPSRGDKIPIKNVSDQEIANNRLLVLVPIREKPSRQELHDFLRDTYFYFRGHEIPFQGIYSHESKSEIYLLLTPCSPAAIKNVALAQKIGISMVQIGDKHYPQYQGIPAKVSRIFQEENPDALTVIEELVPDRFTSWPSRIPPPH